MPIPPEDYIDAIVDGTSFHSRAKVVGAIHDIIDDVLDSVDANLTKTLLDRGLSRASVVAINSDVRNGVRDYIANHYGVEEFGL